MADSLFDNRYRYDYIYPRGRSGETLRAVDTQDGDRPVVIKRPAPNDAPPIRSGQEVSILNERKALMRLAGHPNLTELLGTGQFYVGGMAHQYIVIERAEGVIIADLVRELAARGERMAELEMLVVVDGLLDLLIAAHEHDIVYNDVDAKHLFWDRERYRLKVIDWGNAVFLEGDEMTPQGVSRQSDIFQVAELLYWISTGGGRMEVPRDAGEDFRLNFGDDSERLHSRLQAIISRAGHPNPRLRYKTIAELRKDLADYRIPLERERNTILARVTDRLRRELSRDELYGLLRTLDAALIMDPGYPPSREAQTEINNRLNDLQVSADLDAARIYLESANWARALSVLDELRPRARGSTGTLIGLLQDWAKLLLDNEVHPAPEAVQEAIFNLFEGEADQAAHTLQTQGVNTDKARALQWLLAERISAHVPDILLLRPNLYRLEVALAVLSAEGIHVSEPRALLAEIHHALNAVADPAEISLIALRDGYRRIVDRLTSLSVILDTVQIQHNLPNRKLPLSALVRATNAAMALADNMHVIGKQATSSPRDALAALDSSRQIAPSTPAWDGVAHLLDSLYERLGRYQTFVPAADGSDLESWLSAAAQELRPFTEKLFDEMLMGMVRGLDTAMRAWATYAESIVQGNRTVAVAALAEATEAVGTISSSLAGWFNKLRSAVNNASYPERYALYGALGRALADGWENFDRGRLPEAERLGIQAFEAARNDHERFAARRLRELVQITREWVERGGINDVKRTQDALTAVEALYTPEEIEVRDHFTAQMPSKETYLRAMNKGLVEQYARSSTAAVRILYMNYTLLGALDAQAGSEEDARFWREAAVKTLGEAGLRHVAMRTLGEYLDRRRDLKIAAGVLNSINGAQALLMLESSRTTLEQNPQARLLSSAIYSLRELEAAARDWSDGAFRSAGMKLENAIKAVDDLEASAQINVDQYRAWLTTLLSASADMNAQIRKVTQTVETLPTEPLPVLRAAHQQMVETTTRLLGDSYASTLRHWRDTYDMFANILADTSMRRSAKLARFNDLFQAMLIDRHPAFPLYRHWYDLVDQSPEFPVLPPDQMPQIADEEAEIEQELEAVLADASGLPVDLERPRKRSRALSLLIVLLLLGVTVGVIAVMAGQNGAGEASAPTLTAEARTAVAIVGVTLTVESGPDATEETTADVGAAAPTLPPNPTVTPAARTIFPTITPARTERVMPSPLVLAADTATSIPTVTPSATFTPTDTPTPSATPTPTATPRPTLPPEGLRGVQDVITAAEQWETPSWTAEQFSRSAEGDFWRLGEGTGLTGEEVLITLPADVLEAAYGENAASRIVRMEANLSLVTFNPPLLVDNAVYFGVGFQNAADAAQIAALQVQVEQPGVINLSQRSGERRTVVSRRSDNATEVRIRIDRDLGDGDIVVYFNNEQIGAPITFLGADSPVVPLIYAHSGVILHVFDWTVTLR